MQHVVGTIIAMCALKFNYKTNHQHFIFLFSLETYVIFTEILLLKKNLMQLVHLHFFIFICII